MVDANMFVYERDQMKTARFGAPLALVRDRFVLAIGGMVGRNQPTKNCEAYDTATNFWFPINELPVTVQNTNTIVMNNRFVYLMPGSNITCRRGNTAILIHLLDSGGQTAFQGDKNNRAYGRTIANQRWQQLSVENPDFVRSMPVAGWQIGNSDMIIFGGETTQTFTFDTREVNATTKVAAVQNWKASLSSKGRFGYQSDFVARQFGKFLYVIDSSSEKMLHVY